MAGYNKRIEEMTAAAQEIIDAEREARSAKTAKLRKARLAAKMPRPSDTRSVKEVRGLPDC